MHRQSKPKPKLAVLYARFSPRPNSAECESCEKQIEDLRTWATSNGYTIEGEYRDEALSGGDDWTERPGMLAASVAAKRGMTFLVRSYDRMFRDARKALTFCAMLEAKGVAVLSITEPAANGDDPIAEMVRTIMLAIAEYQRAIIRARTKTRMLQYQQSGRRMSKRTPWGTKLDPADPARLIPDADEIATTAIIVERRAAGASLREICQHLERMGIPRRGKAKWSHVVVKRILEREATK